MISKLINLFSPKKISDNLNEINIQLDDILFNLDESLEHKLGLKPDDCHLEESILNLIRPFLLLNEKNFNIFVKYQKDFNELICPYYFDFYSSNNAPWQLVNKICMGVGNTVIESGLDRTYHTLRFVIRENKDSYNILYINKEHMKDEEVYSNMKSFLENMIEQLKILIETVNKDNNIEPEIKLLLSSPADFSHEALEKRAMQQEINAIKKIMPPEITSKQCFDSLNLQIGIKSFPKEKVKKI